MLHLLDQTPEQLAAWLAEREIPRYRAKQIRHWVLGETVEGFERMTDLAVPLRNHLAEAFQIWTTRVAAHKQSADGTDKLLLELGDGHRIECVLLRDDKEHRTACISTQVGCAMRCVFCASGLEGVVRNLTSGEILEELLRLKQLLPPGERLSHIVVMGMGEPLANLDRLLPALATATKADGLGIGARHITISTVGLPARIRQLADAGKQYHLAVSLHAPNDALRTRIVPTNDKIGLSAILDAADYFFKKTGRQVTFEYVLLGGLNDHATHARELSRLLHGRMAHVNLIPFNEVEGLPYRRPSDEALSDAEVTTFEGDKIAALEDSLRSARFNDAFGRKRRGFRMDTDIESKIEA